MDHRLVLALLTSLSLAAGCMKPNPLLETLAEGDESGEGSETGEGADETAGEIGLDIPGGGELCEPHDELTVACDTCLASACCELVRACWDGDADCQCMAACILGGGNQNACSGQCGGAKAGNIVELQPLLGCVMDSCASAC